MISFTNRIHLFAHTHKHTRAMSQWHFVINFLFEFWNSNHQQAKHRYSENLSPCRYSIVNGFIVTVLVTYMTQATSQYSQFTRMATVTEKDTSNKYESPRPMYAMHTQSVNPVTHTHTHTSAYELTPQPTAIERIHQRTTYTKTSQAVLSSMAFRAATAVGHY